MFCFSTKTEVNRVFKMSDLYKQMKASKEAKKETACIEKVMLKNALSPMTLYCEPAKPVKEIFVFEITVNTQTVPETFIKELDDSIKLHTLFHIRYGEYEYSMLSYKLGTAKGKYFHTNWEKDRNLEVPPVNSVPELYKYIFSQFLSYPPFDNEGVEEYIKRYNRLVKLDFQIKKIESAIAHETQSKKKFEYNDRLKQYKAEKETLLSEEKNDGR